MKKQGKAEKTKFEGGAREEPTKTLAFGVLARMGRGEGMMDFGTSKPARAVGGAWVYI